MVYCVQGTWVVRNSVVMVRGHMIFLHNRLKRVEGTRGSNPVGVVIILAPYMVVVRKDVGSSPPTTTPLASKCVGRFVGIKMSFPKFDKWGKRVRGFLKIFVASIYHPDDIKENEEFNETLSLLMNLIPNFFEFIGGHNVNANLGVKKQMYKKVIGIYGLEKRNMKGQNLLGLLRENNLRFVNTFFLKHMYTTYRSKFKGKSTHMLDVITCSTSFFKCVSGCGVIPDGVPSDHSAVRMVFLNRYIKFKSDFVENPVINWRGVQRLPELIENLNLNLQFKLKHPHDYTSYNAAILSCAE